MIMIEHNQPAQVWTFTPPIHLQAGEPTRYATGSLGTAIRELDPVEHGEVVLRSVPPGICQLAP